MYYNVSKSQINRLKQIQNHFVHSVVKTPKFSHTTPVHPSLNLCIGLKLTNALSIAVIHIIKFADGQTDGQTTCHSNIAVHSTVR